MTEHDPSRDLEARLRQDLRAWTDGVARPRAWTEEANAVLADGAGSAGQPRWRLALAGVVTAAVAVVATFGVLRLSQGVAEASPSPVASGSEPTESAAATASASAQELDLGDVAWWDLQTMAYGSVEGGSASDPVQPDTYRQVRIGTLDGRVSAMYALDGEWGHSFVQGPAGGRVVIVDDYGDFSTIRSVDARTGFEKLIIFTADLVTAAAPAPDGEIVYYAKVDRATGSDLGVWLTRGMRSETKIDEAPEGFVLDELSVWRLAVSPDGHVVAQFCFGEVRCTTHVMSSLGSHREETTAIGWVETFVGNEMVGRKIGEPGERIAMDLDTLESRPAAEVPGGGQGQHGIDFGAELPAGWFVAWPSIAGDSALHGESPKAVQLSGPGGQRVETPPLTLTWPTSCEPIAPRSLPSGRVPGPAVHTLENNTRWATWGAGDDWVAEEVGLDNPGRAEPSSPVAIRGVVGETEFGFGRGLGGLPQADPWSLYLPGTPMIRWTEGDCTYRITVAGMDQAEITEYASAF